MRTIGVRIRVRGQVQGVGFRPFVWALARETGLQGRVLNDASGVLIEAAPESEAFLDRLRAEAPPLARIDSVETERRVRLDLPEGFHIVASEGGAADTRVTPDAATCAACAAEIRAKGDRREGYAFANCTHCGPRFSLLKALPYDRAQTSMAPFEMCDACAAEYADPADRRFHAQPIACPACGPRVELILAGAPLHADDAPHSRRRTHRAAPGDPIVAAAALLRAGQILAVKGLGGFHLACDARNEVAVAALRARKRRPGKPLALMAPMPVVRTLAHVSVQEARLLEDRAAPVVLLDRKDDGLPETLAPGLGVVGWMLPYTPLHHLLLDRLDGPLVMTSGNLSGEPQEITNAGALERLAPFCDGYLLYDREIVRRLDDGVERMTTAGPVVLRRGRGRSPEPLALPDGFDTAPAGLAWGGQLKAAFCLTQGRSALLSHHLGDLDGTRNWDEYRAAQADYAALFAHEAEWHACDLHPAYRPSEAARAAAEAAGLTCVEVQHHHAHMASVMAEHGHARTAGPVAAIVLDGLGYGTDGTIWGGELLLGDYVAAERVAWLSPVPLMGGDAANVEPWRPLLAHLDAAGLGALADRLLPEAPRALLRRAAAAGINAPLSSSAGRLFDAVAAALGLIDGAQSYEGEAAMRLESLARRASSDMQHDVRRAAFAAGGPSPGAIDLTDLWQNLADDLDRHRAAEGIAWRFHAHLAVAFASRARQLVEDGRAVAVALSGGCLQNALLADLLSQELRGLTVYTHRQVPPGDGGLALGQAAVACARLHG